MSALPSKNNSVIINVKKFGMKSDIIKQAIQNVLEENPAKFQKVKPNEIVKKIIELSPDFKLNHSYRVMTSILLKKEKLNQKKLQSNNINLNDDTIKLALRLIIATGGLNEAKLAIESAYNFIHVN
jgi:hypothetical protein